MANIKFSTRIQDNNSAMVLTLNHGENKDSELYKIKWSTRRLIFYPGPSLLGKNLALYCNYPTGGTDFNRTEYKLLQWYCGKTSEPIIPKPENLFTIIKNTDMYCEIFPQLSGSYHYYFIYESQSPNQYQGTGYFSKDPDLEMGSGADKIILHPSAVRCQTVLVKCLGSFSSWESKLRIAKESGYNMLHFTPIQELGGSRSSYSIKDQLKLNSKLAAENVQFEDVERFLEKINKDWKIVSICDIVLNHTANESKWLIEQPNCVYNCMNSPHLRPAAILDFALAQLSKIIANGSSNIPGITNNIPNNAELEALKKYLTEIYIPKLKLWELYQVDDENLIKEFSDLIKNTTPRSNNYYNRDDIVILQDVEYKRFASTVDLAKAVDVFYVKGPENEDEDLLRKHCCEEFSKRLRELNDKVFLEILTHTNAAIDNSLAGVRYERIQEDGPKYEKIDEKHPLFANYFTYNQDVSIEEMEKVIFSENGCFIMAHNGWVMNSDPLIDFAKFQGGTGNVYLRRELIAWGDSVKLRYGDSPEDCPYLWDHMRKYVEQTAKLFHGVRLDNCHSTPLHVAEYLLDCARMIRPHLYVVAELFTNSDAKDNIFVNRLGVTSLIREAQSAWDSHELGRLVYRYGGNPVGAFQKDIIEAIQNQKLVPGIANALFMDLTHDNPSPIEKRSVYDLLPTSALVSMACCGTGSNRGYDELVPNHISVVDEERGYASWDYLQKHYGIILAKKCLNKLHDMMSTQDFSEVYVDQMNENIVAVTRHNPKSHESVILVAYTCFKSPGSDWPISTPDIKPMCFEGQFQEILFEAELAKISDEPFVKDENIINGLINYEVHTQENVNLNNSTILDHSLIQNGTSTELHFSNFKPGSVLAIRVSLDNKAMQSIAEVKNFIMTMCNNSDDKLKNILSKINLNHCNEILYKCDQEERSSEGENGVYDIPNYGPLVYCGLQGFISVLEEVKQNNDLGHPICVNLREGDWMIDYIWQRLQNKDGLQDFSNWVKENFEPFKQIPRYLIPRYFESMMNTLYNVIRNHSLSLMSEFVKNGDSFIKSLGMSTLQFVSTCASAKLPPFSPNLATVIDNTKCSTVSAGLPHFATGYMRCWGRDTFISLRGILLLTGRYFEAREQILGFGACLRHGLIPNLLSGGYNARFNCRDAVWWWLECIKSYVNLVPNGQLILNDKVSRLYPQDDSDAQKPGEADQLLCDVMQEALQKHFQGLKFRERNAGKKIDEHMTDNGFNNEIGVHLENGFVFGGNEWNCGTWMDKMGSSTKACTKGIPATPRDGSAVEIIGLSYSVINWLSICFDKGIYPYEGVERHFEGSVLKWTFKQWAETILANFETNFHIQKHDEYVNQLDIYKDTLGATKPWADFQMRCNFPIAMAVAPELFDKEHAWKALGKVKKILLGPLGIKTLDPSDWAYRGNYDNSNDSEDSSIAQGYNYHQGPEWLWPVGYYLRARLHFAKEMNCVDETLSEIRSVLSNHLREIETNHWRGLPELTNQNGSFCKDSCRTQAWSIATLLEVLYDIEKVGKLDSLQ